MYDFPMFIGHRRAILIKFTENKEPRVTHCTKSSISNLFQLNRLYLKVLIKLYQYLRKNSIKDESMQ